MVPFHFHLLGLGLQQWVDCGFSTPPAPVHFSPRVCKAALFFVSREHLEFFYSHLFLTSFPPNPRHVPPINQHVDGGHFQALVLGTSTSAFS